MGKYKIAVISLQFKPAFIAQRFFLDHLLEGIWVKIKVFV